MREISPAVIMNADKFFETLPKDMQAKVSEIRRQKVAGLRPCPSANLVDKSKILSKDSRSNILDKIASLVDENLSGRSDMCLQFAELLEKSLQYFGLPGRSVRGLAIYYSGGREVHRWPHAWVRSGDEVIDGNVDILYENPFIPSTVKVNPYWGPIRETPSDRKLREDRNARLEPDIDVSSKWWPDLRAWLDETFPKKST